MLNQIEASVLSKDVSARGNNTKPVDDQYSGLTVTHGDTGYVEWTVELSETGQWYLHAHMTAAASRPCLLSINHEKQSKPILGEVTGSWFSSNLQWFTYGPYRFEKGPNVIRIDFTTYMPHLQALGFSRPPKQLANTAEGHISGGPSLPGGLGSF